MIVYKGSEVNTYNQKANEIDHIKDLKNLIDLNNP
jgi:hypothetical protein